MREAAMTRFAIDRRSLFKGTGALVVSFAIPGGLAAAEIGSACCNAELEVRIQMGLPTIPGSKKSIGNPEATGR
jgi:hypothetical protein